MQFVKRASIVVAAALALLGAFSTQAAATTCPTFVYGLVLTVAQWQACFDAKQNVIPYTTADQAATVAMMPQTVVFLKAPATDWSKYPMVLTSGFNNPGDGGDGPFLQMICVPDNIGFCVSDGSGHTFERQNLNGDFRQFGLVTNSIYDALAFPTTVTDFSTTYNAASTILQAHGIYNWTTSRVTPLIAASINIPSQASLSCDVASVGPFTSGIYTGLPGSIVMGHGASITIDNDDAAAFGNCIGVPQWLVDPTKVSQFGGIAFRSPAIDDTDLEAIRGNMILAGDTFISVLNVTGTKIKNVGGYGFDSCIYYSKSSNQNIDGFWGDCNEGIFGASGGGQSDSNTTDFEPFLTRSVDSGGSGPNIQNEESFTIANVTPSPVTNAFGTHLCRLTLIPSIGAWAPSDLKTSLLDPNGDPITYPAWVANLESDPDGALTCIGRGPWAMNVISSSATLATVDLLQSQYGTGADKVAATAVWTAGLSVGSNVLKIASGDLRAFQVGATVSDGVGGANGIVPGSTILQVNQGAKGPDPYDGYLFEITISNNVTASVTSDTAITIDGGAFAPKATFTGSISGTTLTVSAISTGTIVIGQQVYDAANLVAANTFIKSQLTGSSGSTGTYRVTGTSQTVSSEAMSLIIGCDGGLNGGCFFINSADRSFAGSSLAALAIAKLDPSHGRHWAAGDAAIGNPGFRSINQFVYEHHYGFAMVDTNNCVSDEKHNDANGELDDQSVMPDYVAGSTTTCTTTSNGLGKAGTTLTTDLYSLLDSITLLTTTTANINTTGLITIAVGDTTAWPRDAAGHATGALCQTYNSTKQQCNKPEEYVSYKFVDSGHVQLMARGIFNTAPTTYTTGATFLSTVVGSTTGMVIYTAMSASVTNPGLNDLENDHGATNMSTMKMNGSNGRTAYISHNATNVTMNGIWTAGLQLFYEDTTALAAMKGCGNTLLTQQSWECRSFNLTAPTATANTPIDLSAERWPCDATAGNVTMTLPAHNAYPNWMFDVVKVDSSANTCIVHTSGSDTINGQNTYTLQSQWQDVTLQNANAGQTWYGSLSSVIAGNGISVTGVTVSANGGVSQNEQPSSTTKNLANSDCGSRVTSSAAGGTLAVKFPANPMAGCEFTLVPSTNVITVNPNGKTMQVAGYVGGITSILPIPVDPQGIQNVHFVYNSVQWNVAASSPWLASQIAPSYAGSLGHGQVYMAYIASPPSGVPSLELCPYNGSGLIVAQQLVAIPSACLMIANTSMTGSTVLNYLYARNKTGVTISNATGSGAGGAVQLTSNIDTLYSIHDQVLATCYNIGGTLEANGTFVASINDNFSGGAQHFTLIGDTFTNAYISGGTCNLVGLVAATGGHHTASNGVETRATDDTQTLVGMAYVGAAQALQDTATKRDVASWFNPRRKDMNVALGANAATTASATLVTPTTTKVEGEFVVFGPPSNLASQVLPEVRWDITAALQSSGAGTTNTLGACFGTSTLGANAACGNTPEGNKSVTTADSAAAEWMSANASGDTTILTEGRNFMDLVVSISTNALTMRQNGTFIDAYIPQ